MQSDEVLAQLSFTPAVHRLLLNWVRSLVLLCLPASGIHMFDVFTKCRWWLKWQGSNEEILASLLLFASKTCHLQYSVKLFPPLTLPFQENINLPQELDIKQMRWEENLIICYQQMREKYLLISVSSQQSCCLISFPEVLPPEGNDIFQHPPISIPEGENSTFLVQYFWE